LWSSDWLSERPADTGDRAADSPGVWGGVVDKFSGWSPPPDDEDSPATDESLIFVTVSEFPPMLSEVFRTRGWVASTAEGAVRAATAGGDGLLIGC